MGRRRTIAFGSILVLIAGLVSPAEACRVSRPHPTRADAAAAEKPRIGLVGRILERFVSERSIRGDRVVVAVEVTEDFGAELPHVIHILDPGCCMCVDLAGKTGDEVLTIVKRQDDGLFHLDY
ncbi:hypothetical protein [Rhodoplanes sp.]|uniref:hypothetical protein n=1 Tax=Rhodoplanes sp. TaxID=1968906 RepID=UPI0025D39846|nr:hypothetical protein [Rhodoplanes sp.]